jgi:hypothetical protein
MRRFRLWALPVFVAAVALFWHGFSGLERSSRQKSRELTLQSIERAVSNCYAIEGVYPPDFAYLEKNYGVRVDSRKYLVDYQAFASNVRPAIQLLERGNVQKGEEP